MKIAIKKLGVNMVVEYTCAVCGTSFNEDDMQPKWSNNGRNEDLACPGCGEVDELIEVVEYD